MAKTVKDYMDKWGVTRITVYRWVKSGIVPQPEKVGKELQWTDEQFESFERPGRFVMESEGKCGLLLKEYAEVALGGEYLRYFDMIRESLNIRLSNHKLYPVDCDGIEAVTGPMSLEELLEFAIRWKKAQRGEGGYQFMIKHDGEIRKATRAEIGQINNNDNGSSNYKIVKVTKT